MVQSTLIYSRGELSRYILEIKWGEGMAGGSEAGLVFVFCLVNSAVAFASPLQLV